MLACYKGRIKEARTNALWTSKPKIFITRPFAEKIANPSSNLRDPQNQLLNTKGKKNISLSPKTWGHNSVEGIGLSLEEGVRRVKDSFFHHIK